MEQRFAQSLRGWSVVIQVAIGALLTAVTTSVFNVALPDIARAFHTAPSDSARFALGFLLAATALLLPAGRLADVIGYARTYIIGFGLFSVGSALGAYAQSATAFTTARVVQGAGAALVIASLPALLTSSVPAKRRGLAFGILTTATYVGLTLGPAVGGLVVGYYGWRAIYIASALVGCLIVVAGAARLPLDRKAGLAPAFDLLGVLASSVAVALALLIISRVRVWGPYHPATISCGALGICLAPAAVRFGARRLLGGAGSRMFRSRAASSALLSAWVGYMAMFGTTFLISYALRDGLNMSPAVIGRVFGIQSLGMAVSSAIAGFFSDRLGPRRVAAVGMVILSLGLAGLAICWPGATLAQCTLWLLLCGVGMGIFVSPNTASLMEHAGGAERGLAGAILGMVRNLGMSLGISGAGLLLSTGSSRAITWSISMDHHARMGFLIAVVLALASAALALVGGPAPQALAAESRPTIP